MDARISAVTPLLLLVTSTWGFAQESVRSGVYSADNSVQGDFFTGETKLFSELSAQLKTLPPGSEQRNRPSRKHFEELIIVKDGTLDVTINETDISLPEGSVVLLMPGDSYSLRNSGAVPATYYELGWQTHGNRSSNPAASSRAVNWDDLEVIPIPKGLRRKILRVPTSMLAEFEIHTTTLNADIGSHAPHTHAADEVIIVRSGTVEQSIDGVPHRAGPGSVIFLAADKPHAIRNTGNVPAEYYAFKWTLPRTVESANNFITAYPARARRLFTALDLNETKLTDARRAVAADDLTTTSEALLRHNRQSNSGS